ncbi:MAG: SAM-dependent methyltransferase [Patescibacteria group bacterium]
MSYKLEMASLPNCSVREVKREKLRPIDRLEFEQSLWFHLVAPVMMVLALVTFFKKTVYRVMGWGSPIYNSSWFDGWGRKTLAIRQGAASWRALHLIYNHDFSGNLVDDFWIGMRNAQAVRNRYKIACAELAEAVNRFRRESEIRILSLACGSAESVIKTVADFKAKGVTVRVLLVDRDQTALDFAQGLAQDSGVSSQVEVRRETVSNVLEISREFAPHIVEMMGLLDYLPDDKAEKLLSQIHSALPPGGVFLTCNIAPNSERWFLYQVIDWPMIYRWPDRLARILLRSGFVSVRLVYEPHKIHGVAVGQVE